MSVAGLGERVGVERRARLQALGVEAGGSHARPRLLDHGARALRRAPPSSAASHTRRRLRAWARTSVPASMRDEGVARRIDHWPA